MVTEGWRYIVEACAMTAGIRTERFSGNQLLPAGSREVKMDQVDICELLGARIRELRKERGYSQDVLAEISGMNRSYIGSVERAEHNVGIYNLALIAKGLEVPIISLFCIPETKKEEQAPAASRFSTPGPAKVILRKRMFFQLLKQCARDRPDLVAIYLERSGAVFLET